MKITSKTIVSTGRLTKMKSYIVRIRQVRKSGRCQRQCAATQHFQSILLWKSLNGIRCKQKPTEESQKTKEKKTIQQILFYQRNMKKVFFHFSEVENFSFRQHKMKTGWTKQTNGASWVYRNASHLRAHLLAITVFSDTTSNGIRSGCALSKNCRSLRNAAATPILPPQPLLPANVSFLNFNGLPPRWRLVCCCLLPPYAWIPAPVAAWHCAPPHCSPSILMFSLVIRESFEAEENTQFARNAKTRTVTNNNDGKTIRQHNKIS